jgi:hypothetical protein
VSETGKPTRPLTWKQPFAPCASTVETILRDDVDFRKTRTSFRCQGDWTNVQGMASRPLRNEVVCGGILRVGASVSFNLFLSSGMEE